MKEWINEQTCFTNEEREAQEGKWFDLTNIPGLAGEIHTQVSKLLIQCTL